MLNIFVSILLVLSIASFPALPDQANLRSQGYILCASSFLEVDIYDLNERGTTNLILVKTTTGSLLAAVMLSNDVFVRAWAQIDGRVREFTSFEELALVVPNICVLLQSKTEL